ncbi:MAG: hypothetical protein K1X86_01320 [Ignavibacteria bacterium]|nr:hypothetical protein [Ignavibacteria bacterium]
MYSSTLIEIFKAFSPKEIKEFEDFAASPYYNKNKNVTALFNLIKEEYPDFTKGNLTKEKIYKKIYHSAKYNDGTIRLLMFYLQEAAEKYISVKNYEQRPFCYDEHLLWGLNEKNLNKMFERSYKSAAKKFNSGNKRYAEYYYKKFTIEYENLSNMSKIYFDRDEKYIHKVNIPEIFDNLTHSYIIRTFKYYLYYLNTKMKFNLHHKFKVFEELIYTHKTEDYENVPLVNMYYYCLMMTLRPDAEENFFKAKKLLHDYEDTFLNEDYVDFYINLENYCKRKAKIGKLEYQNELFEIYNAEIDKKAYMYRGMMPDLFYKSVVDLGLRLKKYDWTKKFINQYKHELPEQYRENTYLHCLGVYEFTVDNFEKSLELISKVKFDEIYQKLDIKCLLNALYFELKLDSTLESSMDTFRHFIKNDKLIPAERKEPFSIFNKNLSKLVKLRKKPDAEELELFHDNISSGNFYNKEWLLSKLNSLIKQTKK